MKFEDAEIRIIKFKKIECKPGMELEYEKAENEASREKLSDYFKKQKTNK